MAKLERDVVAAFRAGRAAVLSGVSWQENPFDATAELASERLQAKMWMKGYSAGNPVPDPGNEELSSEESDFSEPSSEN